MGRPLGALRAGAAWCWVGGLLAFIVTTVLVLAAALLLATGFGFSSPGIIYLLVSAVVTGLAAASVSVDVRHNSQHRAPGN